MFGGALTADPKPAFSLDDCLRNFTAEEMLDGEEMYSCEVCKKKSRSIKKLYIYRLPDILVIHMKRFRSLEGNPNLSQFNPELSQFNPKS